MGHDVAVASRRADIGHAPRFGSIAEGLSAFAPDYAVVCTRTAEHGRDLEALAEFDGLVTTEKPLFEQSRPAPETRSKGVFVGYQLRFHPLIQALREDLREREAFSAHFYVGSHLADWRPGRDYREVYSASRAQGGGALRDLSHELDLAAWLFGRWRRMAALGGRVGNLEMDSDDAFSILMETERCPLVTVHMNCLDRPARREIVVQTDKGTLSANLIHANVDRDQQFIAMHKAILEGGGGDACRLDEGLFVVKTIEAAEKSSSEGVWVTR